MLLQLILMATLAGRYHSDTRFTDEETEAQDLSDLDARKANSASISDLDVEETQSHLLEDGEQNYQTPSSRLGPYKGIHTY